METSGKKIFSNFLWRLLERCGAQLVALVVSIVLARILEPDDYGVIALVLVITTIMQVFVDSGLGNALIQKKDADDIDFSTVFYTNICFCAVLYLIVFFTAPFIADFYDNATLTPVIRVLGITVIVSGVKNVQQAYVSRNMMFKKFFFSTLGGTIVAAVTGIYLAYAGYGIWALVAQQVVNITIDTIILWIIVKWRPKKYFSFQRLKGLWSFGWKLLVSSLIETVYTNIRQLLIGKMYSKADLAYYNRGEQMPNILIINLSASINSVLFPALSKEQDNVINVKDMTRRAIQVSIFVIAPIMLGLFAVADPLVRLILTEKWMPCVPFLRIFCVSYMFYTIHVANLNAIQALGRSDIYLKLEIIKKVVGVSALMATIWFGPMALAISMLAISGIGQLINSWPNKKLLDYGYLSQLKDILPSIGIAAVMGVCVWLISLIGLSDGLTLLIQIPLGVFIYYFLSKLCKIESLTYVLTLLRSFRKNKADAEKQ